MTEVKKCPFCGGKAVVHVDNGVCVICRECGAHSKCLVDGYSQGKPGGSAINRVIESWNTRKPVDDVLKQLEELKIYEYNDSDEEPECNDAEEWFDEGKSSGRFEAYGKVRGIIRELLGGASDV